MSDRVKYEQNQLRSSDGEINATRPNPATGPGFTCMFCGDTVESLSEEADRAEYEKKWRVHWKCRKKIEKVADNFGEHPAMRSYGHLLDDDDDE